MAPSSIMLTRMLMKMNRDRVPGRRTLYSMTMNSVVKMRFFARKPTGFGPPPTSATSSVEIFTAAENTPITTSSCTLQREETGAERAWDMTCSANG